jgi:hypothetical protein
VARAGTATSPPSSAGFAFGGQDYSLSGSRIGAGPGTSSSTCPAPLHSGQRSSLSPTHPRPGQIFIAGSLVEAPTTGGDPGNCLGATGAAMPPGRGRGVPVSEW